MTPESRLKIAVIGGGVAGITASYLLQQEHSVTLHEKNEYIGGHTNTVVIEDGPDAGTPVDTGFIVFNERTYPLFLKFLSQMEVGLRKTQMSFSYHCQQTGLQYASRNFNALFAQRFNLLNPSFWRMLLGITQLNSITRRKLQSGALKDIRLGDYLERERFSRNLIESYLIPMASAIWSTPDAQMMDFPAESFFRFFENHGLLTLTDQPQWFVVEGGSHSYVKAFLEKFKGRALTNHGVKSVRRTDKGPLVRFEDGEEELYDHVVIAAHANEAYRMLSDPSPDEIRLLLPWSYSDNQTILHTDTSFLPQNRRAWASWNYIRAQESESESPVMVTYHMNRLQGLTTENDYCVTLNPATPVPEEKIIREIAYTHPTFTFDALQTQLELPALNGKNNTCFCGSYFGYGFHEDAVRSAVRVGEKFGITL